MTHRFASGWLVSAGATLLSLWSLTGSADTIQTISVQSETEVISNDTVWNAAKIEVRPADIGNPPARATLFVQPGVTLTIAAGTVVDFAHNFGLEIMAGASLQVNGTEQQKVTIQGSGWAGIEVREGALASSLRHCVIKNSIGIEERRGAIRLTNNNQFTIDDCEFSNNSAFQGGALHLTSSNPFIRRSRFANNSGFFGAAIYMFNSGPELNSNVFVNNAEAVAGGAIYALFSSPDLIRNRFSGNSATDGGAIYAQGGQPLFRFNVINNNEASRYGGAFYLSGSASASFENVTLAYNLATQGGGLYITDSASPQFTNTIIHGNASVQDGDGAQLYFASAAAGANFEFSQLQGGRGGFAGDGAASFNGRYTNMIELNPQFRTPPSEPGANGTAEQLTLTANSPLINAGKPSSSGSGDTDILGRPVPYNQFRIDIGAYEFPNNPPFVGNALGEAMDDIIITLPATDENAPVQVTLCAQRGDRDGHALQVIVASLPDRGGRLYHLEQGERGAPAKLGDVLSNGQAFYEPANRRANYTETFACRVRDRVLGSDGQERPELAMESPNRAIYFINVSARNDAPTFTSAPPATLNVNQAFEYRIEVSDPDLEDIAAVNGPANLLRVQALALPSWLTLQDNQQGDVRLVGTPPGDAEGQSFDIALLVTDALGSTAEQRFELIVLPPKTLLVQIDPIASAEPGQPVTLVASGELSGTSILDWLVLDPDGNTVWTAQGPRTTFTPLTGGIYTAHLALQDTSGSLPGGDSLEFAVANGFGLTPPAQRSEPDEAQNTAIDAIEQALQSPQADTPPPDAQALNSLASLQLNSAQQDTLIAAIDYVLAAESASQEDTRLVLGALHNLIAGIDIFSSLTVQQTTQALNALTRATPRYEKLELIKALEILNALVAQQHKFGISGSLAQAFDAAAKQLSLAPAARLAPFRQVSLPHVRMQNLYLTATAFSTHANVGISGDAERAGLQVSEQFFTRALQEWQGNHITLVLLESNVVAAALPSVLSIALYDASGTLRSPSDLGLSIPVSLPIINEQQNIPMRYIERQQRWARQGISKIRYNEEGDRMEFFAHQNGDYSLLTPAIINGAEASVDQEFTDTVEELSSCLFNSL